MQSTNKIYKNRGGKMAIACDIDIFLEDFQKNKNKFNKRIQEIKESGESLKLTGAGYSTGLTEEQTQIFADAVNALREAGADCRFSEGFTPEQAIDASRKLSTWADDIKAARINGEELSPYEKYIYAYEIASQYIYKMGDDQVDGNESRNVVRVLNGDKIVCAGFANLLKELCDRLDIPCRTIISSPIEMEINGKVQTGHMFCMVEIEDPKYNLSGVMYSDPTMGCPKNEELRRAFGGATIPFSKGEEVYRGHNQRIEREQQQLSGLLLDSGKISSKEDKIVSNTQEEAEERKKQEAFIKIFREYCNDFHLSNCLLLELLKMRDTTDELYATNNLKPEKKVDNFTKSLLKALQYDFWREGILYERKDIPYLTLLPGIGDEVGRLFKNKNANSFQIHKDVMKKLDELSQLSDDEICKYVFGKSYIKAGENASKKIKRANEKFNSMAYGVELQAQEKDELLSNVLKQVGLAMGKTEEEAIAYSYARRKYWSAEQEKEFAHHLQEGKSEEELKEIVEAFDKDVERAVEEAKKRKESQANVESYHDPNLQDGNYDFIDEITSMLGIEPPKGPTFEELVGMQPEQNEKTFEELVGMQPEQEEKTFEELVGMQPEQGEKSFDELVNEKENEQKNKIDDEDDLTM